MMYRCYLCSRVASSSLVVYLRLFEPGLSMNELGLSIPKL